MNKNEEYFISLLSSFLNNENPKNPTDIDFNEIYKLSEIHNVTAIAANQISLLDDNYKPDKEIYSAFRQQLGYTLINYADKEKAFSELKELLRLCDIDYAFVKGIILKDYYPIKELRTSSDIDVIIRDNDLKELKEALISRKIEITDESSVCITFMLNNIHIEAHSNLYSDNRYFDNIFKIAEKNGHEYKLSDEQHLLYILCHIAKHFKLCGAGVRMFMDIDVLIRHINFHMDYTKLYSVCKELNVEIFIKYSFYITKKWFFTPINENFTIFKDDYFTELFEKEIIESGCFGYNKRTLANYYISKEKSNGNFKSKIKILTRFLFPDREYIEQRYRFARKNKFFLLIGYLTRIFFGLFKRRKHSSNTITSIINSNENAAQYAKLLSELDL